MTLLALAWSPPSYAQKIRFAQVTDAHVFDSEGKIDKKQGYLVDSRGENERGVRWAIDEINRRNASGPGYDFVAFTGDFGLEKPAKDHPLPKDLDSELDRAADEFAALLERCDVRTWVMVPGNNDLVDEDPGTINNFHTFITKLQAKMGSQKRIRDFAPQYPRKADAAYSIANCHFFGFDNSSFKSYGDSNNKSRFKKDHEECLKLLRTNIDELLNTWKKPAPFYAYVFCHIPDIDDPHRNEDAWMVDDGVQELWDKIVTDSHVKRVFAGHLHDSDRSKYLDLAWAQKSGVTRPPENLDKLLVCPPIAVKYQLDKPEQARGFRDVLIDTNTGDIDTKIVWLNEVPPPPAMSHEVENYYAAPQAAPRVGYTHLRARIGILIAVLIVGWGAVILVARKAPKSTDAPASHMGETIAAIGAVCAAAATLGLVGLILLS